MIPCLNASGEKTVVPQIARSSEALVGRRFPGRGIRVKRG